MMPKPEYYLLLSLTMKKRDDLILAVEILNYLEDSFIVGWPLYRSPLNPPHGKPMNAELEGYLTSKGGLPDLDKIQNYALKNNIPYWQIDIPILWLQRYMLCEYELHQRVIQNHRGRKER